MFAYISFQTRFANSLTRAFIHANTWWLIELDFAGRFIFLAFDDSERPTWGQRRARNNGAQLIGQLPQFATG